MKLPKYLLTIGVSVLLLTTFCSKRPYYCFDVSLPLQENHLKTKSSILSRNAIWNEDLRVFLFTYEDIYSLTSFQNAYDRLANKTSLIELSDLELADFKPGIKLSPTHNALIIRPANEKQQRSIEQNKELGVRCLPFGQEGFYFSRDSDSDCFIEDECKEDMNGVSTENVGPDNLPVLYVYWPILLDIPDSLSYEEAYPVFIPEYSSRCGNNLSSQSIELLNKEVLAHSDSSFNIQTRSRSGNRLCNLTVYDSLLDEYVPVPGVKILIQPGIVVADTTDYNGNFSIPSDLSYGFVYAVLQTDNWMVSNGTYTTPIAINLGSVASINGSSAEIEKIQFPSNKEFTVQRAAYHLFHSNHEFSCWDPQYFNPIRISFVDTLSCLGVFYYTNTSYRISIKPDSNHQRLFFTTLHELGHFAHYSRIGGATFYSATYNTKWYQLIKESFASLCSWHIGRNYYLSHGYEPVPIYDPFTYQDRQSWSYISSDKYSPFFIDMVDNYNQVSLGPSCLNDLIYSYYFGYPLIRDIIDNCNSYIYTSYFIHKYYSVFSPTTIDNYLAYYSFWNNNNPDL